MLFILRFPRLMIGITHYCSLEDIYWKSRGTYPYNPNHIHYLSPKKKGWIFNIETITWLLDIFQDFMCNLLLSKVRSQVSKLINIRLGLCQKLGILNQYEFLCTYKQIGHPLELWDSSQNTPSTFILANLLIKLHTTAK